ncbi:MAG TPA: FliG C-terminal domain-containing protein, partial [Caulifigura sp.]|nr:FliG C-terminal domain-containing protein [Caulifigura sp.]
MSAVADREFAELLTLLGADVAQAVRPHLQGNLLNGITAADFKAMSPKKRERLIAEFERFLQFVMSQPHDGDKPQAEQAPTIHRAPEAPPLPSDPKEALIAVSPERFAMGVKGEHPRVIAVAVDCLPSDRVAVLLGGLPDELKSEVVREFGKGIKVRKDVQMRAVEALVQKIINLPPETPRDDNHLKRLAEVMRAADKSQRKILFKAIEEQDPEAAAQLTDFMYVFEDILGIEDRAVQQILGQVDVGTLAAALSGAAEDVSDKVFRNLSRRASDMLKEELQFAGRVASAKIAMSRAAIVKLIAKTE